MLAVRASWSSPMATASPSSPGPPAFHRPPGRHRCRPGGRRGRPPAGHRNDCKPRVSGIADAGTGAITGYRAQDHPKDDETQDDPSDMGERTVLVRWDSRSAALRDLIVALGLAIGSAAFPWRHRVIPRRGVSSHGTTSSLVRQGLRWLVAENNRIGATVRRGRAGNGCCGLSDPHVRPPARTGRPGGGIRTAGRSTPRSSRVGLDAL